MKKTLIMALACGLFAANANAQIEKWYGGEQGSFAISVNAEPVINFAGNMLNGTENNTLDTENLAKSIAAKYFVSDNLALTAKLTLDNSKSVAFVYNHEKETEATSKATTTSQDIELRVGIQNYFRPGKRLQPFLGVNVLLGRANQIAKAQDFEFECELDEDWHEGEYGKKGHEQFEATLKTSAPSNTIGLTACVGAELFLSKNISISTSLDLGVKATTSRVISQFETEDKDNWSKAAIKALNFNTKAGRSVSIATGQLKADLALSFYF